MTIYALIGKIGIDEPKALGLDTSMVVVERVPLIINQHNRSIRRIAQMEEESKYSEVSAITEGNLNIFINFAALFTTRTRNDRSGRLQ